MKLDATWIEIIIQISLIVPVIFITEKTTGYKKTVRRLPAWLPSACIYMIWNVYNAFVVHKPQSILKIMPSEVMHITWAFGGLIMMFVILPCFYKGTVLERYFVFFVVAMTDFFGRFCRMLCTFIMKGMGAYGWLERHLFFMLLYRLLILQLPYLLFYYIFRKQFDNYRELVGRHKKVCGLGTLLIMELETVTALMAVSAEVLEKYRAVVQPSILLGVFAIVIYLIRKENGRLYLQKQLLENHYQSVKSQEEQIADMQLEIGTLLEAAESLEKNGRYTEEDLKRYEAELKIIHSRLKREEYCDHLLLDAVLHNKERECEEKSITLDVEMHDLNPGRIADIDLFEIVYSMLELAISRAKLQEDPALRTITISGKNLAGQIVIETGYPKTERNGEGEKQYRRLKRKVKKLGGQCGCRSEGEMEKIIVGMRCEKRT